MRAGVYGSSHWALAPRVGVVAKPSEGWGGECGGDWVLGPAPADALMRLLYGSRALHFARFCGPRGKIDLLLQVFRPRPSPGVSGRFVEWVLERSWAPSRMGSGMNVKRSGIYLDFLFEHWRLAEASRCPCSKFISQRFVWFGEKRGDALCRFCCEFITGARKSSRARVASIMSVMLLLPVQPVQ